MRRLFSSFLFQVFVILISSKKLKGYNTTNHSVNCYFFFAGVKLGLPH
jgi:hypothetical protein